MGDALIVRRGGLSGLKNTDAVLIVTVHTGSTVTATKSGTTLTPTMWVQNADNTLDSAIFSIPSSTFDANAWTVTATLNGSTASNTVVINSNKEYELKLSYNLYLYKNGTIETSVSGGLSNAYSSGVTPTRTVYSTYYYCKGVGSSSLGANGTVATNNAIDLTNYSTLQAEFYDITRTSNTQIYIGATSNRTSSQGNINVKGYVTVTSGSETVTADISSLSGSYYICFGGGSGVSQTWEFKLSKLFLME